MRTPFAACTILIALIAPPSFGAEELGSDLPARLVNAQLHREAASLTSKNRLNAPLNDTTYVGFVPGKVTPTNYWGIGTGAFRPYSSNPADFGYWGWDGAANIAEVHGDSLFGWWPYRNVYTSTGGLTLTDDNRPWFAIDIGNNANYVINQGAGHKRTFGVVGVWHRDNGSASGGGVTWAPLSGSHSLWCGLRRDGDLAFGDPITGNPFNARVLANSGINGGTVGSGIGTFQRWPGYGSQWDQMAYRDVDVTGATTLKVRFRYRTNMSTGKGTATGTRTGWFDRDPKQVTVGGAAAGNFISSNAAGANAPVDSFMVYVGAPVNDANVLYSDGSIGAIYDPQRRWFSEIVRCNEGLYRELLSVSGDNASQQVEFTGIDVSSWGSLVRLVFRNKTNRAFDDENFSGGTYTSGGAGAVVIDDVEVALDSGSYVTLGDFESEDAVDNAIGVSALSAWKSTGKPPGVFHHVHDASNLVYEDLCGPVDGPVRICNLSGQVVSAGDHDNSEAAGGLIQSTADRERYDGIYSPTVNLRNSGGPNEMGIDDDIATVTEDFYIIYEIYTGIFDFISQGNAWRFAWGAWPGRQVDGVVCWADWRFPSFILFNPDKQCFQDQEPGLALSLIQWSSADAEHGAAYPDSLRMYLGKVQQCFRFGITTGCSPTDGCYWDNVSLAFVDGSAQPMSVDIWQWINDTFTVNGLNRGGVAPGSVAFDTTTALVKTGLNIAQTSGNTQRYAVPGDTTVVNALGDNVRLDLVFRIQPGPGNYRTLGNLVSGLRVVPTDAVTAIDYAQTGTGQAFERNFWAQYLAGNGAKGTPAGHPAGAANGGRTWSPLVWNSARCDTAEINLWQISARGIGIPVPGAYATMYEESDPKFPSLGIAKNRCFLTTATAAATQANTVCDVSLTDGWPIAAGYVAESGLPLGRTYEYTRILPDGQFTPGTHVQYFLRREDTPIGSGPFMVPDTNVVSPQTGEGSTDGHRWQQFSVLPDTWKKAAYGGFGLACALVVDLNDRRGNERAWVGIADTIGATRTTKFGAHNGWHAPGGGADINDPAGFVRNRNEQPGTTWDLYGVKASESLNSKVATLGVDLSNHAPSFQITNKWSFQGPSLAMLEAYYKIILVLSGDLNSGLLGPFNDLGNNDVKMLQDFLLGGTGKDPRGLWIQGDGFVESASGIPSNQSLLNSFLYTSLRDPSYLLLTGNTNGCLDLVTQAPISANGNVYGVRNGCATTLDVQEAGIRSVPATLYSPAGNATAPVLSGVYHQPSPTAGEFWHSLVDGWDIENQLSRFCPGTVGRIDYTYNAALNAFGAICEIPAVILCKCTDVPNSPDPNLFIDFMGLRNNPLVSGESTVEFGISQADRVEVKVFDVGGRLVRVLADRTFAPGKYTLTWDGADGEGRQLARGVYFTQVKYVNRGITDARKVTVLK